MVLPPFIAVSEPGIIMVFPTALVGFARTWEHVSGENAVSVSSNATRVRSFVSSSCIFVEAGHLMFRLYNLTSEHPETFGMG